MRVLYRRVELGAIDRGRQGSPGGDQASFRCDHVLLKTILSDLLQTGSYTRFSAATGYWDLPAMQEMLPALKSFLSQRLSLDFLDSLAIQSVHLVKQLKPDNPPDPVIWFGYYSSLE